jgi:hypothetical protein
MAAIGTPAFHILWANRTEYSPAFPTENERVEIPAEGV